MAVTYINFRFGVSELNIVAIAVCLVQKIRANSVAAGLEQNVAS